MQNSFFVIGVMSGTSIDGIDMAAIHFDKNEKWSFDIVCAETISYSQEWKDRLAHAIMLSGEELKNLDRKYTKKLSEELKIFIKRNNLENIDAICSHGHTVLHQPEKGLTYQIGNLPELAELVGHAVVCDFRVQDVEMGGQGAPLVPIGDRLLFTEYDYCINLGGFSNISFEKDNFRIAYDICPVNIVLNAFAQQLGKEFDEDGALAKKGKVNVALLNELNNLPFYRESFPKSLGLEWVQQNIYPIIDSYNLSAEDFLRTFTEHIVVQLSLQLLPEKTVLITGGGAFNSFLMSLLKEKTSARITVPDSFIVEYKEAIIFGLLGVLRLRNEVNVLSSVTGAFKDHSSGKILRL